MHPLRLVSCLALAFVTMSSAVPTARAESGNAILEIKLKATGLPFEIDQDGDFKVLVNWEQDKRSQLVYVSPEVDEFSGMPHYTAFAPAALLNGDVTLDAGRMRSLLEKNANYKVGGWMVAGNALYFGAKLSTDVSPEQLRKLLAALAEEADNLEMELTPGEDAL